MAHSAPWNVDSLTPKVNARVADDRKNMNGPTFNDVRRRFGTIAALSWSIMLWRWGLAGARARRFKSRVHEAPRRHTTRMMRVTQWVVMVVIASTWVYWAFLIVKGVTTYVRAGS